MLSILGEHGYATSHSSQKHNSCSLFLGEHGSFSLFLEEHNYCSPFLGEHGSTVPHSWGSMVLPLPFLGSIIHALHFLGEHNSCSPWTFCVPDYLGTSLFNFLTIWVHHFLLFWLFRCITFYFIDYFIFFITETIKSSEKGKCYCH